MLVSTFVIPDAPPPRVPNANGPPKIVEIIKKNYSCNMLRKTVVSFGLLKGYSLLVSINCSPKIVCFTNNFYLYIK